MIVITVSGKIRAEPSRCFTVTCLKLCKQRRLTLGAYCHLLMKGALKKRLATTAIVPRLRGLNQAADTHTQLLQAQHRDHPNDKSAHKWCTGNKMQEDQL